MFQITPHSADTIVLGVIYMLQNMTFDTVEQTIANFRLLTQSFGTVLPASNTKAVHTWDTALRSVIVSGQLPQHVDMYRIDSRKILESQNM